jgi:superfamily II DNA/RNA helicase
MTLPVALMGTDLIGQARTGTGKTLGFGIPLLQRTISPGEPDYEELAAPGKPQALVVTPTRELTVQVAKDLQTASTVRTVRVLTVYGGVAYEPQLDALKNGVDVVVGTPGRLLDLANRGVLDLGHIKVLVLDEADEMLDLGFLPDVERILRKTPELRQTMLFSATMPSAVIGLARTHMRHPLNIRAESHEDTEMVPTTAQFVYRAHDLDKPEVVARILQAEDRGRVMIFCRTKREASRLTEDLQDRGFKAAAIHGDLNQQARERALTRFRGDKIDVLICTDVAARGIDVEGVTHVINNTCPEDEKAYIHRIGRTGRAGASGIAVTFVDWPDVTRWKTINKALDLPYDEPQEIYSTSPELFHDLGIPSDAKGRIRPAREQKEIRESRDERSRGRRGGEQRADGDRRRPDDSQRSEGQRPDGQRADGDGHRADGQRAEGDGHRADGQRAEGDGQRAARKKRNRTRKRTRAGQPVEELADVTTNTEVPPATGTTADEVAADEVVAAEVAAAEKQPRKRTRTRKTAQPSAAGSEEAAAEVAAADVASDLVPEETAAPVEKKPVRRTRTRKTAEAKAAAADAAEPIAEPAAEAEAETVVEKPKRTRTRKTAEATATTEENAVAEKPKRTRTRKTAETVAEGADEKPAKRTRKTAETGSADEKPAKRTTTSRARKTAASGAAAQKPGKAAPTTPIFSAPE